MADSAILSLGSSGLRIEPMPEMRAPDFEAFVPGIPRPQGSKTRTRWGGMREASEHVKAWRETVRSAAYHAIGQRRNIAATYPLGGPLVLSVEFVFARPRKHYLSHGPCKGKGFTSKPAPKPSALGIDLSIHCKGCGGHGRLLRNTAPTYVTKPPDASKCIRAIEDSLTDAGVWGDDSQVVGYAGFPLTCKRYANPGEEAGARIRVWRVS